MCFLLRRSMPAVVLPDPNDPREWIVCLLVAVVVAFSMYFLLRPLPTRGRTRVMDMTISPPRTPPEIDGERSNSPTLSSRAPSPRSGTRTSHFPLSHSFLHTKLTSPCGAGGAAIPESAALRLNQQPD